MATKRAIDKELDAVLATLPVKQAKFALAYAETGVAYKSAITAGYSDRSARARGSEMTSNTLVMRAVDLLQKRYRETSIWDAEKKMQKLQDIVGTATQEGTSYQPNVAVQAIRELNHMSGDHAAIQVKHNHLNVDMKIVYDINMPKRQTICVPNVDSDNMIDSDKQ